MTDIARIPKCPHCGIYLLMGMVDPRTVEQLKAEYGWKIGRHDRAVPQKQLDAYITGCICHSCPRCKTSLDAYLDNFMPGRRAERERQTRIQQHPVLANHPSLPDAEFTDENDHNPTIREDCPRCNGAGQDISLPLDEKMFNCPDCDGLGYTGRAVRYFANDEPILSVSSDQNGWVECPCCNWRFLPSDKIAWTGVRHKKCGQKLRIVEPNAGQNGDGVG